MNVLKIIGGKTTLALAFIGAALCASAVPTVTIVSVTQRWPWNNKVDIKYRIDGGTDLANFEYYKIKFNATINGQTCEIDGSKDLIAKTVDGTHTVTWTNAPSGVLATGCTMGATLYETTGDYMIIDLDTGHFAFENREGDDRANSRPTASNTRYNTGLYKTDWLVMRRVPRTADSAYASYRTGYDSQYGSGVSGLTYYNSNKDWTTDKDYYVGVFKVTVAQYRKIMGIVPAGASFVNVGGNVYDWCPVGAPSYNTLRNSKTATTALSADASSVSFFERLNAKTGIGSGFDLPTEVMWEIANRAGTTTLYWWYDSYRFADVVACVHCNDSRTKNGTKTQIFKVGSYNSNQWGLYDTMGILAELCRDVGYYADLADAPNPWTPKYDPEATKSMSRGNYWEVGASNNGWRSSARGVTGVATDAAQGRVNGFRLFFVAQ